MLDVAQSETTVLTGRVGALSATAVVDLAVTAADAVGCATIDHLLVETLPAAGDVRLQVVVESADEQGCRGLTVHVSDDGDSWSLCARGTLSDAATEYLRADDAPRVEVGLPEGASTTDGYVLHPELLAAATAPCGDGLTAVEWTGLRIQATGASTLRVRAVPTGARTFAWDAVDTADRRVLSARSVRFGTVRTLQGTPSRRWLFTMDWRPLTTPTATGQDRWATVGTFPAELLPEAANFADLDAVAAAPELPDVCLVHVPRTEPSARTALGRVLELVQRWVGDERFSAARLVVLTEGAVTAPAEPAAGAVWGLVRSAQTEHPDRFTLIDLDGADAAALPAAVASGEPQLALEYGAVRRPELVRAVPGAAAAWAPGTVLITGASGVLGGLLAQHLVTTHGVRDLLLLSRRGGEAPATAALADELRAQGASVTLEACDVADRERLAEVLAAVPAERPLTAVVHAAGALDDGVLTTLTPERLDHVLAAKADGALNLHALTEDVELSAFVLFSSVAGVLGTAGQGNYAAANAFLDALARRRVEQGKPAVSLPWGLWSARSGLTGHLSDGDLRRLAAGGAAPLETEEALELFDAALGIGSPVVVPMKWEPTVDAPPLLRGLVRSALPRRTAAGTEAPRGTGDGWAARLAGLPAAEQTAATEELVRTHTAVVLGHASADAIDAERAFKDFGVDSLSAVQLRNALATASGVDLPTTVVFDHPTPGALARFLRERVLGATAPQAAPAPARAAAAADEPIAVIGMACRFPGGADSPEAFWELLADGADAMSPFPADRGWRIGALRDPDRPETVLTREGGFLHDAGEFDAAFFGISPREAVAMDPQQRLFLHAVWEAAERARIAPDALRATDTGVYAGSNGQDYINLTGTREKAGGGYLITGSSGSVLSGRVAYTLGLEGPALTVDTACSSSLVAIHLAAQSLRRGECGLAFAGGVTVMSTPGAFLEFSRQGGLAADARCKPFAAAADGTAWGEGVGVLLLERLSDAQRNGRRILAVLRGSAVNQDGASNGLTAPNGPAQQRVVHAALDAAGLAPVEVDVVEAHGTGTRLGDPIEAQALLDTYGVGRDPRQPLLLGSVKSNIGHTQAAAGVAGVIKMVLAMQYATVPGTLHIDAPTPHVDWTAGSIELADRTRAWPDTDRPRRAGVSSFGISGTNAHLILEQAPALPEEDRTDDAPRLTPWVLSARSEAALRAQAERLAAAPGSVAEVARSLVATRSAMPYRAVVTGRDRAGFDAALRALARGQAAPHLVVGEGTVPGRTAFLFSGQGAQRPGMGRGLADAFPVFRTAFDEVCSAVDEHLGRPLRDAVWGTDETLLDRTEFTQPGLFAFEVALHRLLSSWGVRADQLAGHSIGEIAAAHVADVLSLSDAAALVVARGRLMQDLPPGAMVSVRAAEEEVRPLLGPGVWVAAVNGPAAVVLSGDEEPVRRVVARLDERGVRHRRLRVDRAFHSGHVDAILPEFAEVLAGLTFHRPSVPVVSSVTGRPAEVLDAEYWLRQVREPVRFADALATLDGLGVRHHLEVGPSGVLAPLVEGDAVAVPALRSRQPEAETMLASVARLHVRGVDWDPTAVADGARARVIDLPTYAFQPERYWWDAEEAEDGERPADGLRHRAAWRPLPTPPDARLDGRWLLVTPGTGAERTAAELTDALVARGAEVHEVTAGAAHLDAVREALAAGPVHGVLSLLALADTGLGDTDVPSGLLGTTALVRLLDETGVSARLWCVTTAAVSIAASDAVVHPVQAALWGLGRVAALEHPENWGGLADLPATPGPRAARLLAGLLAAGTDEDQLAVRTAGLFRRRLVAADATGAEARPDVGTGTVLITGGTGALGAHVARWLARHGARHLLLASRRGAAAPGSAELVAALEADGAEVTVAACDVADPAQLRAALDALPEDRPLTAVVHTAGVLDDGVLSTLTPEQFATVLRPKLRAAAVLHEQTRHLPLAAFVLFSSFAGAVGGAGQANYAAANAFLDALAEWRHAAGLPATAVAWGPWAGAGMAATDAVAARMARTGVHPMDEDTALAALARCWVSPEPATLVVDADWDVFAATAARPGTLLAELAAPAPTAEPAPGTRPAGPAGTAELVRTEIARVLGLPDPAAVEPHRPLRDLGFDSLTSVELRNRLGTATGLTLPSTIVFDHPTADALTRMLAAELAPEQASDDLSGPSAGAAAGADDDPIVVVGMACRLPGGVTSPEDLWALVSEGREGLVPFPEDRGWDLSGLFDETGERPGTSYVRVGGFLDDVAGFDADFFGISPREALAMDPQQRLLLESSWEVFERAGIDPATLRGSRTGVFAGTNGGHYAARLHRVPEDVEGYLGTGNSGSVVSGRVSYAFGLEGPALTIDTACSSSLVALDLAVQSLRRGECSLALAGGVSVMATPEPFVDFSRQRGLAPDGRCKSFAAGADGTAWGEGVGVLLLERHSDALRHGRRPLAVVRGTAVNQDGASNGLTAPNGSAQQRVIRAALSAAGLSAPDVDVVEGHGTGTRLGDPIEARALLATYGRDRAEPLLLGSVKSNIGHTQAAAGVAGVIKMVLAMRHGTVPATLHVDEVTSEVDWSAGTVDVVDRARAWPETGRLRRAGVSSFGISGTNAHVILEQAPEPAETAPADAGGAPPGQAPVPWVLSARTPEALRDQARRLAATTLPPHDIAHSLLTTRAALAHRAVVTGRTRAELDAALHALAAGEDAPNLATGSGTAPATVAFLFSGQGSQRPGMGRELADAYPAFRGALEEVCAAFDGLLELPLLKVMWSQDDGEESALDRTAYTQPALFAFEVALHRLLESWGVRPAVLAGHSIGEIAAAHVAGVLSLPDAAALVSARGRLMQELPAGAMVAVRAPEAEVAPLLRPGAWIAAVNGPSSVVVSGEPEAVTALAADLAGQGVRTRRLRVDRAFHSGHVDAILPEFAEVLAGLTFHRPSLPVVSSVTGRPAEVLDAEYWLRQVREPVRFADALATVAELGPHHHLEIGPSSVLTPLVGADGVAVPAVRADRAEDTTLSTAVAALSCAGVPVDWAALVPPARRVDLPTYAFQHQRYWLTEAAGPAAGTVRSEHPVLTGSFTLAGTGETVLTGSLSTGLLPQLADHVVRGEVVVPGGVLADMAAHAATVAGTPAVRELVVEHPLVVPADGAIEVQVRVHPADDSGVRALSLYRREAGGAPEWARFATGEADATPPAPAPAPAAWPPAGATPLDVRPPEGARLGAAYRSTTAAWQRDDEILVELDPAAGTWDAAWYAVPGLAGPLVTALRGLRVHGGRATRARLVRHDADRVSFEATDDTGRPVVSIASVEFAAATRDRLAAGRVLAGQALFRMVWQPLPLPAAPARWTVVGTPGGDLAGADHAATLAEVADPAPAAVVVAAPDGDATTTVSATAETLRAWLAEERFAGSRLVLLTRHGATTDPHDGTDPAQAALWGLVRSAQTEHPDRFALLDIDGPESAAAVAGAVAAGEPQLALRSGRALTPSLARVDAPAPEPLDLAGSGTVLITGGTGGLGALLARHLVTHRGARRLLLVSRRGPAAPGADTLAAELTALGAEVDVRACDLADREALSRLLASLPAAHPLTAVIHAAGISDDCALTSLDRDRIAPVLAAKAESARHLSELTADTGLKALVLFSSASGVLGGPGQGNYAAANAFLDALAHRVRRGGGKAVSLAWGLWSAPDGLGGRLSPVDLARMADAGMLPLDADEGLALFDRAATATDPFLIPARLDIAGLRTAAVVPYLLRTLVGTRATPESAPVALVDRLVDLDGAAREQAVGELVGRHVARVLGHADGTVVDPDRGLLDLGLDSLTAVELRNQLERATGLRLPATLAFDYPTPRALADHLTTCLAPAPAPGPGAPVQTALDGLEAALAGADPAQHGEVADRLTGLLRRWTERGTPDHGGDTAPDLTEASLTEVLDFIDAEFKLP